jgi:hypothetical protein
MFNKLTYKQKLRILAGVTVLSLVICYKWAITNTFAEYKTFANSIAETSKLAEGTFSMEELTSRTKRINDLLNRYELDTSEDSKNLLAVASNYCADSTLKLREYKPFNASIVDSIRVITRVIVVEGNFIESLKLLHELESSGQIGRVAAADFKSYIDPADKKLRLGCTIYIQNLISSKNENN